MRRGFASSLASPRDRKIIFKGEKEREQADKGRGWGRNFPPPPPYARVGEEEGGRMRKEREERLCGSPHTSPSDRHKFRHEEMREEREK